MSDVRLTADEAAAILNAVEAGVRVLDDRRDAARMNWQERASVAMVELRDAFIILNRAQHLQSQPTADPKP